MPIKKSNKKSTKKNSSNVVKKLNNKEHKYKMDKMLELPGLQSILISKNDEIIFEYGDKTYNHGYLASARKSVLAILYGMYPININKTLKELNIDDKLGLSDIEKTATIKNLMMARSGIYHPASNGGDDNNKPERHSMKPGEKYVYNNWDFNALGTIFKQESGIDIYDALDKLGKMLRFEDFDLMYNKIKYDAYIKKLLDDPETASIHPPYHFSISARDMLKIGKLMLNEGMYNGNQIISKKWIKEMTTIYSRKGENDNLKRTGYGYMWWCWGEKKNHPLHGAYMASGMGGQHIVVIPKIDMIVVTVNYAPRVWPLLEKLLDIKL